MKKQKKQSSNPDQLSFSYGRPLAVLVEEIQNSSRNPQLRKAAKQILEALHTFELVNQTGASKSAKTIVAIQEILTNKLFFQLNFGS